MSDLSNFAFHDLPEEYFPIRLTGWVDGEMIWDTGSFGPYVSVHIPGAAPEHRGKVSVCITIASGEEFWEHPSGT